MESNYQKKYLKYKNKYLALKSQVGGNQILIHVKDKPSDPKSRIFTNDLPNVGELIQKTFNTDQYQPLYKPLENTKGRVYETGKLLQGQDMNIMSAILKPTHVNVSVEQPVFDQFKRLCAHAQATKIFNRCSDLYTDNK